MPSSKWTYLPSEGVSLDVDRAFYDRLAADTDERTLIDSFTVPIRSGRAWPVLRGQLCRIVAIEGPQVADFNAWNLNNPRERFWAARTRQLQSAHVTTHDRLWSTLPYLRPMLTITNETIDYGVDEDGGRCHDLLGSRCDPYVNKILTGEEFDFHCHSNLTRAILPYRLTEQDVHDVLNIFQVTGTGRGRPLFHEAQPGQDRTTSLSSSPRSTCSAPFPPAPAAIFPCHFGGRTRVTRSRPAVRSASRSISRPLRSLRAGIRRNPRTTQGNHGMNLPIFDEQRRREGNGRNE